MKLYVLDMLDFLMSKTLYDHHHFYFNNMQLINLYLQNSNHHLLLYIIHLIHIYMKIIILMDLIL